MKKAKNNTFDDVMFFRFCFACAEKEAEKNKRIVEIDIDF